MSCLKIISLMKIKNVLAGPTFCLIGVTRKKGYTIFIYSNLIH